MAEAARLLSVCRLYFSLWQDISGLTIISTMHRMLFYYTLANSLLQSLKIQRSQHTQILILQIQDNIIYVN